MEIYVDARGYAHDDEGNSWHDGRPEGTYGLRGPAFTKPWWQEVRDIGPSLRPEDNKPKEK